jgi:hypothetical protein
MLDNNKIPLPQKTSQIPAQFQCMNNEFDVATWLANHPRILNLALDIKNAKSIQITNEENPQGSQNLQVQSSQVGITPVMYLVCDKL